MMGRQTGDQSRLFYSFNLEERVPEAPPLAPHQSDCDRRVGRASHEAAALLRSMCWRGL